MDYFAGDPFETCDDSFDDTLVEEEDSTFDVVDFVVFPILET